MVEKLKLMNNLRSGKCICFFQPNLLVMVVFLCANFAPYFYRAAFSVSNFQSTYQWLQCVLCIVCKVMCPVHDLGLLICGKLKV